MPTEVLCTEAKKAEAVLTDMLRLLVTDPAAVGVAAREDAERGIVFVISMAKPDVPRVIGKQGQNVNALRRWLSSVGARSGKRFVLEVHEPR